LPSGDYAVAVDGRVVAAVERKSLPDLIGSLTNGSLRYAIADLAAIPRAAVVVEERYSHIFSQSHVRPALVADGLAEVQVRWPMVPIVYAENRPLAEEWTYRYLAAAHAWALTEEEAPARTGDPTTELDQAPIAPEPSTAELRAWARRHGIVVPDRGRLRPEVLAAWQAGQVAESPTSATPAPPAG
jgi:hypothetical protein